MILTKSPIPQHDLTGHPPWLAPDPTFLFSAFQVYHRPHFPHSLYRLPDFSGAFTQ